MVTVVDEQPVARGSLAHALAEVQANLPAIGKNREADVRSDKARFKYTYADLADVTAAVLPALGKVGLAWTALPTMTPDGRFVLRYSLIHTSGDSLDGEYPLPDPTRTPPQQLGSAITYARRYSLCSVTGVAPADDDDDAAATQGSPASHYEPPPPRPRPTVSEYDGGPPDQPARDWDSEIGAAVKARDSEKLRALWHEARGLLEVRDKIAAASKRLETTPAPAEQKQQRHMHALIREADVTDRADRLHLMSVILNRDEPLTTSSELTATDATTVIDTLQRLKKSAHQGGLPGAVTDLLNAHELRQMAEADQDGGAE